ncbi:MAG: PAS domain-containing protein [Rhodobacteraceae bacterium]|nr:PAS domain-containing protein [Paracoccaceae bacterium]
MAPDGFLVNEQQAECDAASAPPLPDVFDPLVNAFWAYWVSLPKQGAVPHLSDYLDRVPPNLQPTVAIVDVYSPVDMRVRLFGTALVDLIAVELTGREALSIYAPESHAAAGSMAWEAVNRPCGYLCKRHFRSHAGMMVTAPGIALPVESNRFECRTVINFTNLSQAVMSLGAEPKLQVVHDIEHVGWIDIGAGTPN